MKACLDTNILISYLLTRGRPGTPVRIVGGALLGEFEVIVGESTITELTRKILEKRWLRERIDREHADAFIQALRSLDLIVQDPEPPIPNVSRDYDDDYLVAISREHSADYLVSGDKDLLSIADDIGVNIVSPAQFVAILERAGDFP